MVELMKAHEELFRRQPDECFTSLDKLREHCNDDRERSEENWPLPKALRPTVAGEGLMLGIDDQPPLRMSDWSFSQLCSMCGVAKPTINKLSPETAGRALVETLPSSDKPVQVLATDRGVRSVHGMAYTRLWNAELLDVVAEFDDFKPPASRHDRPEPTVTIDEQSPNGPQTSSAEEALQELRRSQQEDISTGLYCGEQDMFAFLIDPEGWVEMDWTSPHTGQKETERFAPGFFVWNSEVGRRSLGIQTFWFQHICQNHIVWDATEVIDFSRKHTRNVRDGLDQIRLHIESLVKRRDERRDAFHKQVTAAAAMPFEPKADRSKIIKKLQGEGLPVGIIKQALPEGSARPTLFGLVDKLTRLSGQGQFAGDRAEIDAKIGKLLALAS